MDAVLDELAGKDVESFQAHTSCRIYTERLYELVIDFFKEDAVEYACFRCYPRRIIVFEFKSRKLIIGIDSGSFGH